MTDILDRLRGWYPVGPIQENGEPKFGWRQFDIVPPIHNEAADEIERLRAELDVAKRELDATNSHLDGAYEAAGHSQFSSAPVGEAIEKIVAERDRLRELLLAIVVSATPATDGNYWEHQELVPLSKIQAARAELSGAS